MSLIVDWKSNRPVEMWEIGACPEASFRMSPAVFRDVLYVLNQPRYERLSRIRAAYRAKARHR